MATSRSPEAILNRSVVTVANSVYTALDVYTLLSLWNELGGEVPKFETNWLEPIRYSYNSQLSASKNIGSWPKDAQLFLFIVMVWVEAKRLNLFEPSFKEVEGAVQVIQRRKVWNTLPPSAARYMGALGGDELRKYLDVVLRARTYLSVRGGLDKNPALANVSWFWHGNENKK